MNFNIEDISGTKKKLTVELPEETVQAELDKALNQARKEVKLKGFRPGKVPKEVVKRYFGPQVEQNVAEKMMNDALPGVIDQAALRLASSPVLEESDFGEGKPFRFTVSFEVMPTVEVSGYEGLNLTKEKVVVNEEWVDTKLEELRQAYATSKTVEDARPLQAGDIAVLDYKAFIADEPVQGGANPNYQVEIGSGRFFPDFENQLVGWSKGDQKDVTVNFPAEYYNPKLAGNEVKFDVTLLDIKEKVVPDLNDEFAKELGQDIKSLDDLKARIREDFTQAETRRVEKQVRDQVRDKLVELVSFEVPDGLVHEELDSMIANLKFNLQRSGLTMEQMGVSEDKIREENRAEALKRVTVALTLQKIAQDKSIEVTDADLQERFMQIGRDTGQSPDIVKQFYIKNGMLDSMKEGMLEEKALNYLIENANIELADPVSQTQADHAETESGLEASE